MVAGLINLIVYLLVVGILIALVYWVADLIPLPTPINRIVKVAVVVIACLIIIVLLLGLINGGDVVLPRIAR